MAVEFLAIDRVIPYANNPRKNDKAVKKVAASIRQYGFQSPIVVDQNRVVVAGHTRLKAAQELGLRQVPVVWAKKDGRWLTEAECRAYRIADNRASEDATWDADMLASELLVIQGDLTENETLQDAVLFSEGEIRNLIGEDDPNMVEIDPVYCQVIVDRYAEITRK